MDYQPCTQLRCRFRLARESSQQLKKALAETEAAHFVGDTQQLSVAFFVSRMGCEHWKTGTSKCEAGTYTQTHGELLKIKTSLVRLVALDHVQDTRCRSCSPWKGFATKSHRENPLKLVGVHHSTYLVMIRYFCSHYSHVSKGIDFCTWGPYTLQLDCILVVVFFQTSLRPLLLEVWCCLETQSVLKTLLKLATWSWEQWRNYKKPSRVYGIFALCTSPCLAAIFVATFSSHLFISVLFKNRMIPANWPDVTLILWRASDLCQLQN